MFTKLTTRCWGEARSFPCQKTCMISLAIATSIASTAGPAQSQDCVDYETELVSTIGEVRAPGKGVAVNGMHAYVAGTDPRYAYGFYRLHVVDISDPAAPLIVGGVNTDLPANGVMVIGNHAYVATGGGLSTKGALLAVDISNPAAPEIIGEVGLKNAAVDLAISGTYAYVVCSLCSWEDECIGDLFVVDISDPAAPAIVGHLPMPEKNSTALDVAVAGSHAFVASDNALYVVDISEPSTPTIAGSLDIMAALAIAIAGNYAYVFDLGSYPLPSLAVVDISSPPSLEIIGRAFLGAPWLAGAGVAVDGTTAYVVSVVSRNGLGINVLKVVDISNPTSPRIMGGVEQSGAAMRAWDDVVLRDDLAFIVGPNLRILPAQCETASPVTLSQFAATATLDGVSLTWETSFESNHLGFVLHRAERSNGDYVSLGTMIEPPGPYGYLDTSVTPGVTYSYRLEAVDRSGGREFYGPVEATAVVGAPTFMLLQNQPNPFGANPGVTVIGFVLGERVRTKLRVFDTTGRLVRSLLDEPLDAGEHGVWWDGRTDTGEETGSGVYYYRLDAGSFSKARALVRIR